MPRAEREQQMLGVAEQIFAERGYNGASMEEIAERVGVSKPMLYEYFGSKDGLFLACIARARAQLGDVTRRAIAGAASPEEQLWCGLLAFFEFIDEHARSWYVLLSESALMGGPVAEEIEATRRQQTDLIAASLAANSQQLSDTPLEPHELEGGAQLVVGACERLSLWRQHHPEVTAHQAARIVMETFWVGLRGLATGERWEPQN